MARQSGNQEDFVRPVRRLAVGLLVLCLLIVFVIWRIDSPRAERFRAQLVDWVVPNLDWALVPVTETVNLVRGFESYAALQRQNRELRDELQRMKAWKEAALQLEQENAKLLDLNNVRLDPALTVVTGQVLADSGSPFRQSVLLNVGGQRDGALHRGEARGESRAGSDPATPPGRDRVSCGWRALPAGHLDPGAGA